MAHLTEARLSTLFETLWEEQHVDAIVAELDRRAALLHRRLMLDIAKLPSTLQGNWRRRLASWEGHAPRSPAEAVLAEHARVQAAAMAAMATLVSADSSERTAALGQFGLPTPEDPLPPTGLAGLTACRSALEVSRWGGRHPGDAAAAGEILGLVWDLQDPHPAARGEGGGMALDQARDLWLGAAEDASAWRHSARPLPDWYAARRPVPMRRDHLPMAGRLAHASRRIAEQAQAAGGLPMPLLLPFPDPVLSEAEAAAWRDDQIPTEAGLLGLAVYTGANDPWLHWNTWGHPAGLVLGAILPPEAILHVGDPNAPGEHALFWGLYSRTRAGERDPTEAVRALREELITQGVMAVARCDLRARPGRPAQEIWLLEAAPPVVHVLEETLAPTH